MPSINVSTIKVRMRELLLKILCSILIRKESKELGSLLSYVQSAYFSVLEIAHT